MKALGTSEDDRSKRHVPLDAVAARLLVPVPRRAFLDASGVFGVGAERARVSAGECSSLSLLGIEFLCGKRGGGEERGRERGWSAGRHHSGERVLFETATSQQSLQCSSLQSQKKLGEPERARRASEARARARVHRHRPQPATHARGREGSPKLTRSSRARASRAARRRRRDERPRRIISAAAGPACLAPITLSNLHRAPA